MQRPVLLVNVKEGRLGWGLLPQEGDWLAEFALPEGTQQPGSTIREGRFEQLL